MCKCSELNAAMQAALAAFRDVRIHKDSLHTVKKKEVSIVGHGCTDEL